MQSLAAVLPGPTAGCRSRCARGSSRRPRARSPAGRPCPPGRTSSPRRARGRRTRPRRPSSSSGRPVSRRSSVNGIESALRTCRRPCFRSRRRECLDAARRRVRTRRRSALSSSGSCATRLPTVRARLELWSIRRAGVVDPESAAVQLGLDAFEPVLGTRPPARAPAGRSRVVATVAARGVPAIVTGFAPTDGADALAERELPGVRAPRRARDDRRDCSAGFAHLAERSRNVRTRRSPPSSRTSARAIPPLRRHRHAGRGGLGDLPVLPKQLDLSRLLVDELRAIGLEDAELTEHGYVFATLPGTVAEAPTVGLIAHVDTTPRRPGAGVAPDRPPAYAGAAIGLPGDPSQVLDPADELRARGAGGARHRHERRHHAARRRRQGRGRRDHDRGRLSRTDAAPRAPCASGSRSTRRSARGTDYLRPRPVRRGLRLHVRRLRARRARDRDLLRRPAEAHGPGRRRASGNRKGEARERDQAARRLHRRAAARHALAGDDRGARRVRPSGADLRERPPSDARADRPRPRRREARGARRARSAARRRRSSEREPRASFDSRSRSSTGTCGACSTGTPRSSRQPRRRSAAQESSRCTAIIRGGTDGARLTARVCRRRTSSPAARTTTRCASGRAVQDMAAAAATAVELVRVWGEPDGRPIV